MSPTWLSKGPLDFVVADAEGRTYQGTGLGLSDYYCFDKPVLAPADGVVETVVQHLPDNAVGDVDTRHNWGNTVVLRHQPGLYSQLSHLRAHSVRVRAGQVVRRGEVLAACGSSGRSPEPHLHFQVQATPAIGSPTLAYPLEAFLSVLMPENPAGAPAAKAIHPASAGSYAAAPAGAAATVIAAPPPTPARPASRQAAFTLKTYAVPQVGEAVQPVRAVPALARAWRLLPGYRLAVRLAHAPEAVPELWEVFTDAYNQSYLRCAASGAVAYFELSEAVLQFTAYYGPRRGWLRELYLAAYRVPLCFLPQPSRVALPLSALRVPGLSWVQDALAPFWQFIYPEFSLSWAGADPGPATRPLQLRSSGCLRYLGRERVVRQATLTIADGALTALTVQQAGRPDLQLVLSEASA